MREENNKQRLARLIAADQETISPETEAAARRDFCRVAAEYFETEGKESLQVTREKGGYRVTLSFRALRVKNFTTLKG